MKLAEIFETRIGEKIDPVIKVREVQDEAKLASEIGAYVVTPKIEKFVDEFPEHFTDTFRLRTTEIGAWISGYFGSGKSHLAKVLALLAENRTLQGHTATKRLRYESRQQRPSVIQFCAILGASINALRAFLRSI